MLSSFECEALEYYLTVLVRWVHSVWWEHSLHTRQSADVSTVLNDGKMRGNLMCAHRTSESSRGRECEKNTATSQEEIKFTDSDIQESLGWAKWINILDFNPELTLSSPKSRPSLHSYYPIVFVCESWIFTNGEWNEWTFVDNRAKNPNFDLWKSWESGNNFMWIAVKSLW